MPTEKPRYTVIVDKEMLTAIDNFRFEHRYPSRSAAALELIRLGLGVIYKQEGIPSVAWKDQSSDSEDLASEI